MARAAAALVALCVLLLACSTAHAAKLSPARSLLQVSDCSRIPTW